MNSKDAQEARDRLKNFEALEKVQSDLYSAIRAFEDDWPDGPCNQNPFTGNWRESRQLDSIEIQFTATRGKAPPVSTKIERLHIEASALGRFMIQQLREKLTAIQKEMEKI